MSFWTSLVNTVESWLGTEEKKVASFLKPIIDDVVNTGKTDILEDIAAGLPTVAAALTGNGLAAAVTAAESFIKTTVEQQGVTLATTTVTTLANSLAAQAQAAAAPVAPTPAPIPAAA